MRVVVDDARLRRAYKRYPKQVARAIRTDSFPKIDADWKGKTARAWKVRARGGRFRGETWDGLKEQRPGVPAWGGTPKKRGKGKTKGRKRPSGQRVKRSSIIAEDTAQGRNSILSARLSVRETRRDITLTIGKDMVKYMEYQDELRPFMFLTRQDKRFAIKAHRKAVARTLKRWNRGRALSA